ncbi:MAG: twin-arginine translocation signal domain-containing protein, partial [Vicinamibacteraceae bacterium]
MKGSNSTRFPSLSRRDFLRSSSAAVLTGALAGAHPPPVRAQGRSDLLRVGLIGCGGRGTGAAMQALEADPNVKLTAMGDAFEDRLEQSLRLLQRKSGGDKIDVPQERRFVGFDAYQRVIDSGVDVVLLAEPPHFRP